MNATFDTEHPAGLADNPELLGAVLDHYREYALAIATSRLAHRELRPGMRHCDAEDIVQEAMLAAVRRIGSYNSDRTHFRSFIARRVREACNAVLRFDTRKATAGPL